MKIEMQLEGLQGVLATLRSLPPEVVSRRGGPVKSALRKGARVIFLQARANLENVTTNQTKSGERLSTGLVLKNLVVTRGKPPEGYRGERYLVRIRRRRYTTQGKTATTQQTAYWLEYGTRHQPMEPWLRPAFNAKAGEAVRTVEAELRKQLDRVVAKLAQQNKGK